MSLWTRARINAGQRNVLTAEGGAPFTELAKLAGLDPARDFRATNLSDVDFSGCDLAGYDFSGARLFGCNFGFARIKGMRFDKAELGLAPAATGGEQRPVFLLHQHEDWSELCRDWRQSEQPPSDDDIPPHTIFRDAPFAPEMVVIPAGRFTMGSPEGEPRRPKDAQGRPEGEEQHEVTIESPFAMGRFAVTFDEYDWFCEATRAIKLSDRGWGRGRRPVINVSCEDAERYCAWLSEQTGEDYRLPSEAKWEYACRSGTTTPFWWGSEITPEQANYNGDSLYEGGGEKGEYRKRPEPVDAFEPNPWGLYQMHGNVFEWCEDAWNKSYEGVPKDGSTWASGDTSLAVLRGGSWSYSPQNLRSAVRDWNARNYRNDIVGFRVSRTLRGR